MWKIQRNQEAAGARPEVDFRHRGAYLRIAAMKENELFRIFDSSRAGLSDDAAAAALVNFGPNEVASDELTWRKQLLKTILNPFIILLLLLSLVSYITGDLRATLVMLAMVFVSVCLTFFQEFRSSRAAQRLKELVTTTVTVVRRVGVSAGKSGVLAPESLGRKAEIPLRELVPGDVVQLAAGDMIPADLRLFSAKTLFVAQAAMTGESIPIEKSAEALAQPGEDLLHLPNICLMGTNVVSGSALGIVLKTGRETYIGSLAQKIAGQREETSFDRGIRHFTWLMLRFMFVMVPIVFLVNGFLKHDWFDAFLFAVAVAVGITPEMLPMIVTVNLARGALTMSRKKAIVKRLSAIQNFGAIDVLCTDKTGTLTQDEVALERYTDPVGNPVNRVLRYAYLNSYYQTGLRNLLDVAILKHVEVHHELDVHGNYKKVDEVPFDFVRRRMSVIVERKNTSHVLICKGALEELFSLCTHAEIAGEKVSIQGLGLERCQQHAQALNDDGLRVLAVAYKEVPADARDYTVADESDLTLLGFVAFLDPPKESAPEAIRLLNEKGVSVKVLTGDNDRVTRNICAQVGIPVGRIVLGTELEGMSDDALDALVEGVSVFAKLSPFHKERIVKSLRRRGRVVGFMGDGINDSPALRAADVGISVDNAVDIAKESADIILLEKSLLVLEEGILEGRRVFGNIVKYIKMGASSNFGNVFSLLGASALLPFLPMLPVQLLTQNLLYDLSQTAIPFDHVDDEYLDTPRRWEIGEIGRFMLYLGPVSSLFDYATFAVLWFVFRAQTDAQQSLFQSGWFVEGLVSQTLIVHIIRTRKIPFLQSRASGPMIALGLLITAVGLALPFSPVGESLGLVHLPGRFFPWLGAILLVYAVTAQLVKDRFVRKYGFT